MSNVQEEPGSAQQGVLHRMLGVGFGIAILIGGTIGIGILRNPGVVAGQLGNRWWIMAVWIAGGIHALLGANYMSELGAMIPKAGGPYVFSKKAFGNYVGFVVGWNDWFMNTASIAFLAIAVAEYVPALIPAASPYTTSIAIVVSVVFFLINLVGLRSGSDTQKITSALKTLALVAFVVACFAYGGGHPHPAESQETSSPAVGLPALFAGAILAMQAVISTYTGWNVPIYFAEEDRDPGRNLPRSLIGGVLLVIVIYVLVNAALLYVLPVSQIAGSKLPAADAADVIFGTLASRIVTGLAMISLLSIINAAIMQTPRTLFALSRDGLCSARGTSVNKGGTPAGALIITVTVALVLVATGTFEQLLAVFAFLTVGIDLISVIAFFWFRVRAPELPRPFKAWGYPGLPLILLVANTAICIGFVAGDTRNSLLALIPLAISYPAYLLITRSVRGPGN